MARKHDCGAEMVEKDGQQIDNVEITRWYCSDCSVIIHNFKITTEEPLNDAQALLDQE